MMTAIREKTRILLYVLVFCFIALIVVEWGARYSDIGHRSRGMVGKINGEDIRYADFARAYNNQTNSAREQKGGDALTESENQEISEQVWDQAIQENLLGLFIKSNKIMASDSEIVYELRNNPPEFIRNSQTFLTDGKFDYSKYQQALNNPQFAKEWAYVESVIRTQLPFGKLQSMLNTMPRVTESELRTEYARRNLKLSAQLIYVSPAEFPAADIAISDDEIKTYYNSHKEDFKDPAKARMVYVHYNADPTKEDSADVLERIQEAKKDVLENKNFGEAAKLYSSDRAANQANGSLGWFTKGMMVKEFEDAVFNAKKGDILGPVKTQFGYHIIKIDSTRFAKDKKKVAVKKGEPEVRDSVMASHILIKMEASQTTIESARENASSFYETAKEEGFSSAFGKYAAKYGLTADTTLEIVKNDNGTIAGFPDRLRQIVRFAFSEKPGSVARPHMTAQGYTVFGLLSRTEEGIQPLESVKERVRSLILEEKRKDMAFEKAKSLRAKMTGLGDIKKVDSSYTIRDLNNFTMNSSIPGVGRDARLNGILFNLPVAALSDAVKGTRGAYLIQIFSRDELNESRYTEGRTELKRQLLASKQQRAYREWLDAMKKKADIKDFRQDFNL